MSGEQTGLGKVDAERRAADALVAETSAQPEAQEEVDVEYYTRYASQLDESAKRAADETDAPDAKRTRTEEPEEEEDLDMDDVI